MKITLEQFKAYIIELTNNAWVVKRHGQFDADEEVGEAIKEYDPQLSELFQRNVDNGREFYAYVLWKYGEEK